MKIPEVKNMNINRLINNVFPFFSCLLSFFIKKTGTVYGTVPCAINMENVSPVSHIVQLTSRALSGVK